jgi:hypothetical protein
VTADFGIPALDLAMAATGLVVPVTKWGTRRRSDPMPGTYHFFCHDFHFTHLVRRPDHVPATGCRVAVEPNFSTTDDMPEVQVLWLTHQKRRIARAWQDAGVKTIVDLNVCKAAREINLIGVPAGWPAFATRAHRGVGFDAIHDEWLLAAGVAGTEDFLFCVFGGGKLIKKATLANGWTWVPEHRSVVAGREVPYEIG